MSTGSDGPSRSMEKVSRKSTGSSRLDTGKARGSSNSEESEAARVVMKEIEKAKKAENSPAISPEAPEMEKVSGFSKEQMEMMDQSALEKKSRVVQERLAKREVELKKQAMRIEKLKAELQAIEAPMKKEILEVREKLEDANRRESSCVATINELRKTLFASESELKRIRENKMELSGNLLSIMRDYEKRKEERLNELSDLVGDEKPKPTAVTFGGF
uniref:RAB6-interacting golgin n=1 Tax=Rhodosorus marinus TaxID=101924 RepID=A0A7S0BVK8_9RHOD|mmetsp:Transcript_9655/g.14077  ORF Transcript_9655/g.14077 Transcript_9655/m.14077 type:complete len:217 (+) Transcript_9655:67-717(+)